MGETKYSDKDYEKVLESLTEGKTLRESCVKGLPSPAAVLRRCSKDSEYAERYVRAMEISAHLEVDSMRDVERDESIEVQRAKLIHDGIKWRASKRAMKVYGDKTVTEQTGKVVVEVVYVDGDE